jgi:ParB family chromosome partitioning protein
MKKPEERKLGRGLSVLFGESKSKRADTPLLDQNSEMVRSVEIKKISAGIYQPRKNFDPAELKELAHSIKENGLIQPIILRKIEDKDRYEIIAGERRFRAATLAGLTSIAAIVKKISNHEALELAIVENIQRADLSLIEEAAGYQKLIEEFSYVQDQVAKKVGKSRSHIANLLRLLSLPKEVRDLLDEKLISMGHARAIVKSSNPVKLAKKTVDESLTVRQLEDLVREEKIKNDPAQTKKETKSKNGKALLDMAKNLSVLSGMEAKISYDPSKKSGKILIKFSELSKIQKLLKDLANVSRETNL